MTIGSGDHPVRRDGLPADQLHSYSGVPLYQNAFNFGSETKPSAQAVEPVCDTLNNSLRAADRIARITGIRPRQRKEESESGQLRQCRLPQRNSLSVDP